MNPKSVFTLFFLLNVLNYIDRQVTSGVLPLLKIHFHASDAALGALGTAFMITYALTAIPFGAWSDRWKPHKVAAIGALVWSLATISSALAWSVMSLFLLRAVVGVGEAAFVSTGSTILSGIYPQDKRSRILGWFNLGLPIGGAIGVMAGGAIGEHFGWPWAFALVGIPGLILAYYTWRMPMTYSYPHALPSPRKFDWQAARKLFRNKAYIYTCLGYAGISYAFGAIVLFAPMYLQRDFGYSVSHADFLAGVIQVGAGLLGAPIGGYVADAWRKRNPRGRAYTVMLAVLLSAVCLFVGLSHHSILGLFLAAFFMLWHAGVASSLTFDVTDRRVWNTAQGVSLLLMHGLGDVPSSILTGVISDHTSLVFSLSLLSIPMALAALFFFMVSVHIPKITGLASGESKR